MSHINSKIRPTVLVCTVCNFFSFAPQITQNLCESLNSLSFPLSVSFSLSSPFCDNFYGIGTCRAFLPSPPPSQTPLCCFFVAAILRFYAAIVVAFQCVFRAHKLVAKSLSFILSLLALKLTPTIEHSFRATEFFRPASPALCIVPRSVQWLFGFVKVHGTCQSVHVKLFRTGRMSSGVTEKLINKLPKRRE